MEDTNYLDLIILKKIDASSSVEKFGTLINTSFFETANLLGTLKVKGLLDIQSSMGGQSPVSLTGEGKELLEHASRKAAEEFDDLDIAILSAMAGGVRDLGVLASAINIRPKDLAFRLNKLKVSDYIDYEVRAGKVFLSLTEKGFMLSGGARGAVGSHPAEQGAPPQAAAESKPAPSGAPAASAQAAKGASPAPKTSYSSGEQGFWSRLFGGRGEDRGSASNSDISEILEGEAGGQPAKKAPQPARKEAAAGQPAKKTAPPAQKDIGRAPPWVKQPKPSAPSSPWQEKAQQQKAQVAQTPKQTTLETAALQTPPKSAKPPRESTNLEKFVRLGMSEANSKQMTKEELQSARLASKIEYYVNNYWLYGALLVALILLLAFAALVAFLPK